MKTIALLALGSLVLACHQVQAQEPPAAPVPAITVGASTAFESRYLWYGLVFGGGAVQQSSVCVSTNGYTLSVWNNFVLACIIHETLKSAALCFWL
jgi:hypothetical protein